MNKISPTKELLQESFNKVKTKTNFLERECTLLEEANKFDLPLEDYKRLFDFYIKHKTDETIIDIPDINKKNWKHTLIAWKEWFQKQSKLKLFMIIFTFCLEKGTIITVGIAAIKYIWRYQELEKQAKIEQLKQNQLSWDIINSMDKHIEINQPKNFYPLLITSLEILNINKVNLSEIKISRSGECSDGRQINLKQIDLENVKLGNSRFFCVNFSNAKFFNADLRQTVFQKVNLNKANLEKSELNIATFQETYLRGANLRKAGLEGTSFQNTDLTGAVIKDARLCDIDICADFRGAKNLTIEQIKSAKDWEKAHYDEDIRKQLGLPPENTSTDKKP